MAKVLLLNGIPNAHGCTATALEEMVKTFQEEGITAELIHIGNKISVDASRADAVKNLENVYLMIL